MAYTKAACEAAAAALNLKLGGNGYDFAGVYGSKGCYAYSEGSYKGRVYYGLCGTKEAPKDCTKGDAAEQALLKLAVASPKYRIANADCSGAASRLANRPAAPHAAPDCCRRSLDAERCLNVGRQRRRRRRHRNRWWMTPNRFVDCGREGPLRRQSRVRCQSGRG